MGKYRKLHRRMEYTRKAEIFYYIEAGKTTVFI